MKDSFSQDVYETLCGFRSEGFNVPGVENLFGEGMPCTLLYGEMWEAYERLLNRLGLRDEDADVEAIINALLSICEKVGAQMYHYGTVFGREKQYSGK